MKKFHLEQNKGKRTAYVFMIVTAFLVLGAIFIHFQNAEERKPEEILISKEIIIDAFNRNDEEKLTELASQFGITLEDIKDVAGQLIEMEALLEKQRAREATLGSWEDALKTGTLVRQENPHDHEYVEAYYDVTGDGIADFVVYHETALGGALGAPAYWRYCDESGEPYG